MERKLMEMKMNAGWTIVNKANSLENPLDLLPSFQNYKKDDFSITLETKRVSALDASTKEWIFKLLETNMKDFYFQSDWGWNSSNKKDELFEDDAWYLIARDAESQEPVAFSHFRYDMDHDDDVLYCYEIQTEKKIRRKGIGKFMMKVLELLMIKADLLKIMLTVFKHNQDATTFFKEILKYEVDETCPVDTVYEQFDYEILSRFNAKEKKRREEKVDQNDISD